MLQIRPATHGRRPGLELCLAHASSQVVFVARAGAVTFVRQGPTTNDAGSNDAGASLASNSNLAATAAHATCATAVSGDAWLVEQIEPYDNGPTDPAEFELESDEENVDTAQDPEPFDGPLPQQTSDTAA